MSNMLKTVLIPAVICMFCLTACTTLPLKALYTDPIAADIAVDTVNSRFDVVYAIDCCVMPKPKDDFVSFKINTMLCTYRLDFSMNYGMKDILERFFTISAMADTQKRKNGVRYLGETPLYAYALSEDTLSRLVVDGRFANHVRLSFLLKDGKKYLLLERFHVKTLDKKLPIDDSIDSIPFQYDDIKKVYDFFNDTEALEITREKQLQIVLAAKRAEKDNQAVVKAETVDASNIEESSIENQ